MLTFDTSNSHRSDIENPNQLSISGTPSGVQTPRPSGTDKRLPGILHSYFGQVGASSFATSVFNDLLSFSPMDAASFSASTGVSPVLSLLVSEKLPNARAAPKEHQESRILSPFLKHQAKTSMVTRLEHEVPSRSPTSPISLRAHRHSDERCDNVSQPGGSEILKSLSPTSFNQTSERKSPTSQPTSKYGLHRQRLPLS